MIENLNGRSYVIARSCVIEVCYGIKNLIRENWRENLL